MTLEELAYIIDKIRTLPSWESNKEKLVRVRLKGQVSIGPLASSDVTGMWSGFDWDNKSYFIETTDPLIRWDCPDNMKRKGLDTEKP